MLNEPKYKVFSLGVACMDTSLILNDFPEEDSKSGLFFFYYINIKSSSQNKYNQKKRKKCFAKTKIKIKN